jgi:hypothetical protein
MILVSSVQREDTWATHLDAGAGEKLFRLKEARSSVHVSVRGQPELNLSPVLKTSLHVAASKAHALQGRPHPARLGQNPETLSSGREKVGGLARN